MVLGLPRRPKGKADFRVSTSTIPAAFPFGIPSKNTSPPVGTGLPDGPFYFICRPPWGMFLLQCPANILGSLPIGHLPSVLAPAFMRGLSAKLTGGVTLYRPRRDGHRPSAVPPPQPVGMFLLRYPANILGSLPIGRPPPRFLPYFHPVTQVT